MIVVISPAKNLDLKQGKFEFTPTIPEFLDDAQKIINNLKRKSIKSIESLMSINRKIASLNKDRFLSWEQPFTIKNAKPAILTFRGEVYIGLDAASFDKKDLEFAQKHLRILSGLYGLLRPYDLMQPYRLEMGTNLKINRCKNLYAFWDKKIAKKITKALTNHEHPVLIHLASDQYFDSVQPKTFTLPVIRPIFKEKRGNQLKSIHVYAKRARGLMVNFIIKKQILNPEDLKKFDIDGYRFNKKLSTNKEWFFIR
jgi:uncharacterized protein